MYPSNVKIKKQMEYANRKNIKYVLIYGEEEKNKNVIVIKNMHTGVQEEKKKTIC
jgi:histidyl-tRNA synthetase